MSKPNLFSAAAFLITLAIAVGGGDCAIQAQVFMADWQSKLTAQDDRVSLLPPVSDDSEPLWLAQNYGANDSLSRASGASGNSSSPAASPAAGTSDSGSTDRLIDHVTDPIAPLMQFRFRENWNWPLDGTGPDSQTFEFRPTIPFKACDQENLLRITVPYNIQGSQSPGLGKVQIFDALVFDSEWGKWGIGPDVRFDPASTGQDAFQMGPVLGAVAKTKHWTYGFIVQNYLGGNNTESFIQPVLAHKFNDQLALALGDMQFKYDWSNRTWTQLPLGCELDYIANLWGQKIQWFINPQYNFKTTSSNSGWTVFVGLVLLVPGA